MAQAARHSSPNTVAPSSLLGHSMWVSWWKNGSLGSFLSWLSPFSPTTNFIPQILHAHLIHSVISFHRPVMVRKVSSTGTLVIHGPSI